MARITLTREQLYQRVWATPIVRLAREFGLSDRGLGKLCARHGVPVPPRGYWAKKAAGKRVSQTKLPVIDGSRSIRIDLQPSANQEAQVTDELHPLIEFEHRPENRIRLLADAELTDPAILKAHRRLAKAKRETDGRIGSPSGAFSIHTSRGQHDRALRIMQGLVVALRGRGFQVQEESEGPSVMILDEKLAFGIEEETRRIPHAVTFTEQKQIDRGVGWGVPKWDLVPAERLTLVIRNVQYVRQRWSESAGHALEEILNKFIIGLVRAALGLKAQRAEAERREKQRQEEERLRAEEAKRLTEAELRYREEQARVERLERLLEMWARNRRLSEFVAAVRDVTHDVRPGSETDKWLEWAEAYLSRSDPFVRYREASKRTLTLYYYGYDRDHVAERGFAEPTLTGYGNDKAKPGVELTERPPRRASYERALAIQVPEDAALPFEWAQPSENYWRTFQIPADVLNRLAIRNQTTSDA